ncbi:MAG: T9SS type A sorting domain-containing protein [Taibaiella sp.]|nr:T9SS type A sorting domain-containing protein [Taibaiella sp.]
MKKISIVAVALLLTCSASAQKTMHGHEPQPVRSTRYAAKTTAIGDTLTLTNIGATDTTRLLYMHTASGSGPTTGTNSFNDKGFAERYYFNAEDSSVKIIGVVTQFGGAVNPASAKTVTLKAWSQGSPQMITARTYYEGFPATLMDSIVVPVSQLGIGTTADTMKTFMFAAPTGFLSDAFFVGYTINYNFLTLDGDTVGLKTSTDGNRTAAYSRIKYNKNSAGDTLSVDTLINVQNATLWTDNQWHDNYTQNDSLYNNLAIFPIVVTGAPTGITSVFGKGLTLFGASPNPATNNTSISFSVAERSSVSVCIADINGRIVIADNAGELEAGKHTISVSTDALPAGDYIYLVRTTGGQGIAGKLVIVKN